MIKLVKFTATTRRENDDAFAKLSRTCRAMLGEEGFLIEGGAYSKAHAYLTGAIDYAVKAGDITETEKDILLDYYVGCYGDDH